LGLSTFVILCCMRRLIVPCADPCVCPAAGLEDGLLKLCTCLGNSREEHMIIQPDESDDEFEEEGGSSGSDDDDSDSGSEHDSGEGKAAAGGGGSESEGAAEANGHDAEGRGSHGGDERHTHKDGKKVGVDWCLLVLGVYCVALPQQPASQFVWWFARHVPTACCVYDACSRWVHHLVMCACTPAGRPQACCCQEGCCRQ
jgi:hypothetical protein